MADQDPVASALNSAKSTLKSANNFTHSVIGNQKNEFSHASYSMAKSPAKSVDPRSDTGLKGEAASAGAGIKARMENEAAAKDSLK